MKRIQSGWGKMVRVALIKGENRYDNIKKALETIREDICKDIEGKKSILLKPNLVSSYNQLSATHVDTVKAILDFIEPLAGKQITIGEGSAYDTQTAFKNYRFNQLQGKYNVKLIDLNNDNYREVYAFDRNFTPIPFEVAQTVLDSDYIISAAMLKTHDNVIVTMTIKNMVVGSLVNGNKRKIHQGYPAINLNLYKLSKHVWPKLSVIDGFTAMEGNGPEFGEQVDMKIAIASNDPLAADTIGAYVMGFDPNEIGYLNYLKRTGFGEGNLERIDVIGENVDNIRRKFKPHSSYMAQREWKISEDLLAKLL
ncbi:MAG: DUF362 domain-containing protein [Nitrososphaeria archaeon]